MKKVLLAAVSFVMLGALLAPPALANTYAAHCFTRAVAGFQASYCIEINEHKLAHWRQGLVDVTHCDAGLDIKFDIFLYRNDNLRSEVGPTDWRLCSILSQEQTDWDRDAPCADVRREWYSRVRIKLRSPGGTVSDWFVDRSGTYVTNGC
jgi:hypothetical protein